MRRTTAVLFLAICASFLSATAAAQRAAAKYDQQILQDVDKYIQSKKEFQGIKAPVEDQTSRSRARSTCTSTEKAWKRKSRK